MTDRSAKWAQPHDGWLFLASSRAATLELPGLTMVSRKDRGPVDGDIAIGAGVHLASRPRALLDNTRRTRRRGDRPSATMSRAELADWIDHLCAIDGPATVSDYRDIAETLADILGVSTERVETLNDLVGAALDTRESTSQSAPLKARAAGVPYDQSRVTHFELLASFLRNVLTTHPALPADAARRTPCSSSPTSSRARFAEDTTYSKALPHRRSGARWRRSSLPRSIPSTTAMAGLPER